MGRETGRVRLGTPAEPVEEHLGAGQLDERARCTEREPERRQTEEAEAG